MIRTPRSSAAVIVGVVIIGTMIGTVVTVALSSSAVPPERSSSTVPPTSEVPPTSAVSPPSAVPQICEKFGSTPVSDGRYIVQNAEWGNSIGQCISPAPNGFSVVSGYHDLRTDRAPGAYPSIFAGCHFGKCSTGSGLPLRVSALDDVRTSVSYSTVDDGQWNASYDIWLDSSPNPSGQNNGAEIMLWTDYRGTAHPAGGKVGTVTLAGATWDVWKGHNTNHGVGWNLISYVRHQTTNSLHNISVKEFTDDAVNRGYVQRSWYVNSIQFGFEPWQGGPGLAVHSFSVTTGKKQQFE